MELDELLNLLGAKFNVDEAADEKAEKLLKHYLKLNNFTLYDEELAEHKKKKDYFFLEMKFFFDIINTTRKHFQDLPDIIYLPRRYFDFTISRTEFKGKNIIFAEELILSFLTEFSCLAFFISMAETIKDGDIKKYKKWMIAVIDIYACQHKQMWRDETMLEVITKNEMSSKYACFMARAMYTFIICHEVAHIIYKHTKETSIRDELDADALGYEIFCALILDSENLTTLEFFEGLRRAPLALFDIFELVEYYKETIHNKTPLPSGHPLASLRKAALLNQFDFGNNVESFDLYLVISEKASALKHYIYEHRVGMREEVQRIHNDNFKC